MRCELPILRRCCCCFPLRYGLLVWAYIQQIFSLLYLVYMIAQVCANHKRLEATGYALSILTILFIIVDIIFHILFIISAHLKDYRKMRIFYRYSIIVLCINGVVALVFIGLTIFYMYMVPFIMIFLWSLILPALLMTIILLFLQVYLIILVRSEFIKLKNNSQFEFVNHAADEKVTANLDFLKGIPTTV